MAIHTRTPSRLLHTRHILLYRFFRVLLAPYLKKKFAYTPEVATNLPTDNFLLISNHNTDFDPLLIGISFPQHLYYVASEHLFHLGFRSSLLRFLVAPIARRKGTTAVGTAVSILDHLRKGYHVCLFAEGNRSYDGQTCPIFPATGKMARSSKKPLVTYRMEGGYFTSPRWSSSLRRGKMRGYVVNVYSPQQLRAMTADEINTRIYQDLYEDAYETQHKWKVPYQGKNLAQDLELLLYRCPKCEQIGTLHSCNDTVYCDCGLSATYTAFGYLEHAPFTTLTQWRHWQQSTLEASLVLSDTSVRLQQLIGDARYTSGALSTITADASSLTIHPAAMTAPTIVFAWHEIQDITIYGRNRIAFSTATDHYQLVEVSQGRTRFNALKYLEFYQFITHKDRIS